jgi:hypothetical protein
MTKLTKKIRMALAAFFMGADLDEVRNPEEKIYTYDRGISGSQIVDFGKMTHEFDSIVSRKRVSRDLHDDICRIINHIDEVKAMTEKDAFSQLFDKIYNNSIMEDLVDPNPIDTYLIDYLRKKLRHEGYRKNDLKEAESDAIEMANQYVEYHKVYWNYTKVLEEDFNRAERHRA